MMITSSKSLIGLSVMFFVLAVALGLTVWGEASLTARIGMFVFGFASGVTAGGWLARRNG